MTSFGCHQTATGITSCHISKALRLEFVLEEKSEKVKKLTMTKAVTSALFVKYTNHA